MDIKRKCRRSLIAAILVSVGFVAGIPLIILGATSSGVLKALFLTLGIALTVIGFYGAPLLWIGYGKKSRLKLVYCRVVEDGVRDISLLAQQSGQKFDAVLNDVNFLINRRYLKGYAVADNFIVKVQTQTREMTESEISGTAYSMPCPVCGAQIVVTGLSGKCEYCGAVVRGQKKN